MKKSHKLQQKVFLEFYLNKNYNLYQVTPRPFLNKVFLKNLQGKLFQFKFFFIQYKSLIEQKLHC